MTDTQSKLDEIIAAMRARAHKANRFDVEHWAAELAAFKAAQPAATTPNLAKVRKALLEIERLTDKEDGFLLESVHLQAVNGVAALDCIDAQPAADVDDLANFIRSIDGRHSLGAGALAEKIVSWLAGVTAQSAADGQRERPNFKSLGEVVAHVLDTGEAVALTAEEGERVMTALRKSLPQASAADEPVARLYYNRIGMPSVTMLTKSKLPDGALFYTRPQPSAPVQVPKGWQLVARGAEVQWTDPQGRTGRVWDQNGELKNKRAFARLVRSLLSAAPAPTTQKVPEGWMLSTADFSVIASGGRTPGRVMLIRDPAGKRAWLGLPEEVRDSEDGPPLFVTGYGATFQEALSDAAKAAALTPSLTSYEMNREEGL